MTNKSLPPSPEFVAMCESGAIHRRSGNLSPFTVVEPRPTDEVERAPDGRCPHDGQSLEWHQHVGGTHYDGSPRTNGEFIGCDYAEREAGR